MKPGKRQKSQRKFQDLCWNANDRAKSFVSRSYTRQIYITDTFLLVFAKGKDANAFDLTLRTFLHGQGQKKKLNRYGLEKHKFLTW